MKQVGITKDGKPVMNGIGAMYHSQGIPLAIIFEKLHDNNMVPCWITLYKDLVQNGMPHDRVIHLLNENVFEGYGKEMRDGVISRLQQMKDINAI